jgi:uroporphyrinogen decarboxylase
MVWRKFVEELEGIFYPVPHIPITFFSALFEGVTPSRMAYYMRKNPEFLHYLLKEYTRTQCDMVNLLHDAGVEVVEWGDDVGVKGRLAISLNQFKEFILPYYKQLYQHVRRKGMMMIQHSCGYVDPALPYMAEAGLHAIQALQQTAGVDLKHLVESLGDKIAFMGALDDSRIIAFGTPKEVKEDVKKCIKIAGKTGNYAPGPSHGILNASLENLNALRDSIDKYSKFPISF